MQGRGTLLPSSSLSTRLPRRYLIHYRSHLGQKFHTYPWAIALSSSFQLELLRGSSSGERLERFRHTGVGSPRWLRKPPL